MPYLSLSFTIDYMAIQRIELPQWKKFALTDSTPNPGNLGTKLRGDHLPTWLNLLADRQNVSLRILEPGGFRASAGGDAVNGFQAGHVVLFKNYASGL